MFAGTYHSWQSFANPDSNPDTKLTILAKLARKSVRKSSAIAGELQGGQSTAHQNFRRTCGQKELTDDTRQAEETVDARKPTEERNTVSELRVAEKAQLQSERQDKIEETRLEERGVYNIEAKRMENEDKGEAPVNKNAADEKVMAEEKRQVEEHRTAQERLPAVDTEELQAKELLRTNRKQMTEEAERKVLQGLISEEHRGAEVSWKKR